MAGRKRARDTGAERAAVAAPGRRFFGPEAMAAVVEALRRGATLRAAAKAAGFDPATVHEWRRKAAHFGAACRQARDGRRPALVPAANGHGAWRMQRPKQNAFTRPRKEVFLAHFAATCDFSESADVAGVSVATAYNHRRSDPAFAAGCDEALQHGYARLEADAVAQRIAALARLKVRLGKAVPPRDHEVQAEFDRVVQLLREHKRGLAGATVKEGRPPTRWSFEVAMAALEKRLAIFGVRIAAEGEEESEGEGESMAEEEEEEEGEDGQGDFCIEETPPPPCGRSPSPANAGEDCAASTILPAISRGGGPGEAWWRGPPEAGAGEAG